MIPGDASIMIVENNIQLAMHGRTKQSWVIKSQTNIIRWLADVNSSKRSLLRCGREINKAEYRITAQGLCANSQSKHQENKKATGFQHDTKIRIRR